MSAALKYIVNSKGDKISVIVPIKTWQKINKDFTKLQQKNKLTANLKEAFEEIRESKRTGKKMQTLKEFLNEI
jgi:hypothetical protein